MASPPVKPPRLEAPAWASPRVVLIAAYACLALGPPLTKWLSQPAVIGEADAGLAISFVTFLLVGNLSAAGQVLAIFGPAAVASDLRRTSRRSRFLLAASILPALIVPALMFLALQRTTVVNAVVLTRLGPLVYALAGSFLLRRALSRSEAIGFSLTGAGIFLIALVNGHLQLNTGDLLVIAATVTYSASAYVARLAMAECRVSTFVFVRNAGSAAVFLAIVLAFQGPLPFRQALEIDVWLSMAPYALVALVAGQWSLYYAVGKVEPATVANWSALSPALSVVFAYLLLCEQPTPVHFFAIALLASGAYASQFAKRLERAAAEPAVPALRPT